MSSLYSTTSSSPYQIQSRLGGGIVATPTNKFLQIDSPVGKDTSIAGISNPRYPIGLPAGPRDKIPSNLRSMYKKLDFKHPACKNWLIHLHYVRKEFETCKAICNEELHRLNGNSEYANYTLALIYRSEGKMQESLDRLQICHQLEPTNVDVVRQIARSLFLLGRHKLAINAYQKSQALNDDADWETHYNMGLCFLYMQELTKAKDHMNLSLQARVSHEAFQVLAQIALMNESPSEAISVYERAIKIFPENADMLSSLGLLYMKSGKDPLSFGKLGTALAFDRQNTKALVAMASMMQMHDDYDYGLGKYRLALQNIPDSSSLWNNIGMCYFGKRKYVAAISCLKRANYLSSFDWKILHNLGLVHLHMQQYASAFHFLTAAINLKPDQSHNFMLLAIAISHLGDTEHSTEAYEQALRLNKLHATTDNFKLLLNYSISLFNHKKYSESCQQLTAAAKYLGKNITVVEDEENDLYNRMKTALQLHDYTISETVIKNNLDDSGSNRNPPKPREISEEEAKSSLV